MTNRLFFRRAVLTAALAALSTLSTSAAGVPAAAALPENVITVVARLVEIPGKLPADELYDYAYVMKYQVIGGPLDQQTLYVAHYKPRQPRAKIKDKMKEFVGGKLRSFTAGDTHKMKLTPDLKKIWTGALTDEYAASDRKSVRHWCLEVDPA